MDEMNLNKYLTSISKIIRSDNPKFMAYVSKEYMKYRTINPVISETIESMIFNQVTRNSKSPYAIFLDYDHTINLDAMNDISRISNIPEFISHVQELSKYDVDFHDLSSDDLIIEGSEIADKLAQDLENENLSEEEVKTTEEKADTAIKKMGILALIGGTIGAAATTAIAKIKGALSRRNTHPKGQAVKNEEKEQDVSELKSEPVIKSAKNESSFDEICPKVNVDEKKVIKEMQTQNENNEQTRKKVDTYGDGDPDGDDIDL